MSRVGKKPIVLGKAKPKLAGSHLTIEGPLGVLQIDVPDGMKLDISDQEIVVTPVNPSEKKSSAMHGLTRSLIQNLVTGVTSGYEKRLEINGVGFRAKLEGKNLVLALGFSHPIIYPLPEGIKAKVENKDTLIILNGIDKQLIGNVAATIRQFYPPEPYKGKGVKYTDEIIRRKKGKRVA